jgi:hypothetical protein
MRVLALTVASTLLLAGCSGNDEKKEPQQPAEVEATESSSERAELVAPGPEQRAALVKELKAVDRGLVPSEDRMVADAMATCRELLVPGKRTGRGILDAAQLRFSGQVELTREQTRTVVTAVRDNVCPDAAWP